MEFGNRKRLRLAHCNAVKKLNGGFAIESVHGLCPGVAAPLMRHRYLCAASTGRIQATMGFGTSFGLYRSRALSL